MSHVGTLCHHRRPLVADPRCAVAHHSTALGNVDNAEIHSFSRTVSQDYGLKFGASAFIFGDKTGYLEKTEAHFELAFSFRRTIREPDSTKIRRRRYPSTSTLCAGPVAQRRSTAADEDLLTSLKLETSLDLVSYIPHCDSGFRSDRPSEVLIMEAAETQSLRDVWSVLTWTSAPSSRTSFKLSALAQRTTSWLPENPHGGPVRSETARPSLVGLALTTEGQDRQCRSWASSAPRQLARILARAVDHCRHWHYRYNALGTSTHTRAEAGLPAPLSNQPPSRSRLHPLCPYPAQLMVPALRSSIMATVSVAPSAVPGQVPSLFCLSAAQLSSTPRNIPPETIHWQ
ncbi:hypothetical protein C8F01DRAFT_1288630 [Mycena amicta]|nr:hypothetical protein C8F01DRAFT_1288630 [Mycena amicta]